MTMKIIMKLYFTQQQPFHLKAQILSFSLTTWMPVTRLHKAELLIHEWQKNAWFFHSANPDAVFRCALLNSTTWCIIGL